MGKTFQPQDKFFHKAKEQNYRARSVFKLEEIQKRFGLIKPGDSVLDLGAAPGSFMQLIAQIVGEKGLVVGLDLKEIKPFKKPNVISYVGDIFDELIYARIMSEHGVKAFNVVTSDLAPATSGIKSVDAGRSFQLNEQVLKVAGQCLKKGGHVLLKAFPGMDHDELLRLMKAQYKAIKVFKPAAVRQSSREVYLIGLNKNK